MDEIVHLFEKAWRLETFIDRRIIQLEKERSQVLYHNTVETKEKIHVGSNRKYSQTINVNL